MARPRKSQDYVVHCVTDLFQYSDGLPWSRLRRGDLWEITLADHQVVISGARDIHLAIGELLCKLKPEYRPHILRQIANALKGKPGKLRKSSLDDIAKIRLSWRKAQAEQKGLYRGDNPTFKKVAEQYHNLTGFQLDRRALKNAGVLFVPTRESKKCHDGCSNSAAKFASTLSARVALNANYSCKPNGLSNESTSTLNRHQRDSQLNRRRNEKKKHEKKKSAFCSKTHRM